MKRRANIEMNAVLQLIASFPLTPALSLGEREKRSPFCLIAKDTRRSCVLFVKQQDGECNKNGELSSRPHLLFPLPEGEGQGEGKLRSKMYYRPKTSAAVNHFDSSCSRAS